MKLSDKLLTTRTAKKLSKQEVADMLGMDVTTYGRVEAGKRNLEIDKLKLLPEALGIEPKEIIDLLEIDKGNVFNIGNGENATGNASGNGYVENIYTENTENLAEIKSLYTELLQQKDSMIEFLKKENDELKKLIKK
jgi:transcriptional regulator with XRE-family HTH domain